MAKTLKISTASIKSALNKAGIEVAEYNEFSGRCTKAGATITTVKSAYANGKIQVASYVSWDQPDTHRYRPLTDEERAAWRKATQEGVDRIRLALVLAGYAVQQKTTQIARPELIVTLP